jgi:hypothetical protein
MLALQLPGGVTAMSTTPLDLETDDVVLPPPEMPARVTLAQPVGAPPRQGDQRP